MDINDVNIGDVVTYQQETHGQRETTVGKVRGLNTGKGFVYVAPLQGGPEKLVTAANLRSVELRL